MPIVEHNPIEGVQNNVFGTWRAAEAAIAAGVETFVLVSTDKAVRPTSVMGATKTAGGIDPSGAGGRGCGHLPVHGAIRQRAGFLPGRWRRCFARKSARVAR